MFYEFERVKRIIYQTPDHEKITIITIYYAEILIIQPFRTPIIYLKYDITSDSIKNSVSISDIHIYKIY